MKAYGRIQVFALNLQLHAVTALILNIKDPISVK